MKKKNLTSLKLNKKSISNLDTQIIGGFISDGCRETDYCPLPPLPIDIEPMKPLPERTVNCSLLCTIGC